MVVCFLCRNIVNSLRALRVHFQFFHSLHTFEQYRCAEDNCTRSYQLFNSFRRHYIREHYREEFAENGELVIPNREEFAENGELIIQNRQIPLENDNSSFVEPHTRPTSLQILSSLGDVPLETALASLVAILYGSANLPRNVVQDIIENIQNIISHSILPLVSESIENMIGVENFTNSTALSVIHTINNVVTSGFNRFSTEYRRLRYFESCQTYIPPQAIIVGECRESNTVGGDQVLSSVPYTLQFISLRKVLHAFFSLESILIDTLQYMTDLYRDVTIIQNFIQGNYWQSRRTFHASRTVVPLFLFFDDYETSNALGSHSGIHKLGAVYVSIPCLPPWRCSVLSNIFLTLLFHSYDRLRFGNNIIFQPVIEELNYLSTIGISLDVPNFSGVVYFELALILGDNLGIHSITGFVESFSSNYPCRICRIKKEDLKVQCYEDKTLLRCNANYNADLLEGNTANSGVKEKCVWLKVKGFDLFKQVGVDVMHDILEGVGKYVMGLVLMKYITRYRYFTVEFLNNRLSSFAYGPDSRNKPVQLNMLHINRCNVRLSASEMLTFIRYFSILVGDKIPGGDSYWALYLKLREVVELVMATCVWKGLDAVLQDCVTRLNHMYLALSNETLKPKFHHLTHYHNALIDFGPLSFLSSMRYEAKHRLSKTSARASCNRRNITLSLSIKHQLKLNEIFTKGSLDSVLTWGPKKLKPLPADVELIQSCLHLDDTKSIFRVRWLAMSSVRYHKGSILVCGPINDRNSLTFLLVDNQYICNDDMEVIFTGTLLQTIVFDYHYYAYEVENQGEKIAIWYRTLQFQTPHTLNTLMSPRRKLLVTLRTPI